MIAHVEKGAGMIASIEREGHSLWCSDGQWFSTDDQSVQLLIDLYTLDEAKKYVQEKIAVHAKKLKDKVISTISAGEMASWPGKLSEAKLYVTTQNASDAGILSHEAETRGVPLLVLCGKVLEKGQQFAMLEAVIAGIDGKHRDAVDACQTFADVSNYDYSTDWPDV